MRQLHELLWYLTEAFTLQQAHELHEKIDSMIEITEGYTWLSPDALMELDIEKHWDGVNALLIQTSELVRGQMKDELKLPFKYKKTFGGRADLSAKGDSNTKLPPSLIRPIHWLNENHLIKSS